MLSMTGKEYTEIRYNHSYLLDSGDAFDFVHAVLIAEADAIKAREPYATKTIERLEAAAYEVFSLAGEVAGENFSDGA